MALAQQLNNTDTIPQQDSAERAFNKLARTFTAVISGSELTLLENESASLPLNRLANRLWGSWRGIRESPRSVRSAEHCRADRRRGRAAIGVPVKRASSGGLGALTPACSAASTPVPRTQKLSCIIRCWASSVSAGSNWLGWNPSWNDINQPAPSGLSPRP
jgi:hypothetical protein